MDSRARAQQNRKQILLMGAIDMGHVIAAAKALQREHASETPDEPLIRALETGMVVSYWRPFSPRNSAGRLREKDAYDLELHELMKTLRNQVHAHIDSSSGRSAGITPLGTLLGVTGFAFTESMWESFPEDWLGRVVDAASRLRDAFRDEAMSL
jgi:hypothetical protein